MRERLVGTLGMALLALLASACGTQSDPLVTDDPTVVESPTESPTESDTESPTESPTESIKRAPGAVPEVLAFTAATIDGGTLTGAELAGRPVVFWFWSPY